MVRAVKPVLVLVLLLVVVAATLGAVGVSMARTAAPTDPGAGMVVSAVHAGSVWAPSVYFETDYARCSGSLVGPRTVITAAHCLGGISKVDAWVGHHRTAAGKRDWLYQCHGTRVWAATAHPGNVDDDDWGMFDVDGCVDRSGRPAAGPVGTLVGFHGVAPYADRDPERGLLYAGYPGGTGALVALTGDPRDWPFVEVALSAPGDAFGMTRLRFAVQAGGSGGPLLAASGDGWYWLVGLDKGLYRNQAHFVKVDQDIADTVLAARAGRYPAGSRTLTRKR